MNSVKILYFHDRKDWRKWLERNYYAEKEVWLIYPKKDSDMPRIQYNDAVEEALCFGWIDSTVKSVDDKHSAQRFTPRNINSKYSQTNKERLKWLAKQKMLHPLIEETVQDILDEEYIFPSDILDAIEKDNIAWDNYGNLSDSYKRVRIAYIDAARKRPEEFRKRLKNFIEKTRDNKLIPGFGGISKYY